MSKIYHFLFILVETIRDVLASLRRQYLSRTYLIAIGVFALAVIFGFLSLSPVLSSFLYPLF